MKNLCILVWLMIPAYLFAQKIDRKVHDFGQVEYWNNPIAEFMVTNNTKADIMFLPTFPAKDVLVQLPQGAIKPGETAMVSIQYYTEKKGSFSRTVSLYTSNTGTPLEFTLKGDIRSFAAGALTECPTVGPKNADDKMYSQEFQVIDSITREPISGAYITLKSPDINNINTRTAKDGIAITKVFLGYYQVEVSASSYKPFNVRGNLAPHQGRVVFELTKVLPQEPAVAYEPNPIQTGEEPWMTEPINHEPAPVSTPNTTPTTPTTEYNADGTLNTVLFKPNNIVFVLDISSSMKAPDKLPKLKESMKELVAVLRDVDYVTVITFSKTAQVHIPTTQASNKQAIYDLIDSLTAYSYTNGTKGIMMGYDLALQNFISGGNNQLIVSTDGEFNNPSFDANVLLNDIKQHTEKSIILSVVGFGNIPEGKRLMRRMANNGNGNYIHFGEGDTQKALIDEIRSQSLVKN